MGTTRRPHLVGGSWLDDTTDDQFPSLPELSHQLPGFRLIRKLSETRMSVVYVAEEPHLGNRLVAVKVMSPALAHEKSFRERFRREVLSSANLSHPNIVPVFSAPADDELLYLVMPYIDGPNLSSQLRSGPLDPRWTVHIIREVAQALDFAHGKGVVHRDVKPGNILLERGTNRVYLCDFGIAAKAMDDRLTEVGRRVGTPGYLAPELIPDEEPDLGVVDPRADVYSLGVVLYQCLTGRAPHNQSDTGALLWEQRNAAPPKVSELRPDLPVQLDRVLEIALAKQPENRYATCQQLADDLARALSGARIRPRKTRRRPGRWKPLVAAAAALALVATVLTVVLTNGGGGSGAESGNPLERIPHTLRAGCRGTDPSVSGATDTSRCFDGEQEVVFSLFADQSTMDSAYSEVLQDSGINRATGDCTVATGAEHRYPNGGTQVGRALCYVDSGTTRLVWTNDRARTIAEATARESTDQELAGLWAGWVGLPAFPTADEQTLIDLVELGRCKRAPAGGLDSFRNLHAAIECDPLSEGAVSVTYYRFGDVESMRRTYDQHVGEYNPPSVACHESPVPAGFLGNRGWDLRSVDLGSMLCYQGDRGVPMLEWTVEPLLVMARASGTTPEDLVKWWNRTLGMPVAKIVAASNETADPPFPTAAESALLQRVPETTRVNCLRPPEEQKRDNVGRTDIVAVVCGPSPAAGIVFYYQFDDVATMTAAYLSDQTVSGGDCQANPPNFSGDSPYAARGDTGRLACGTTGTPPQPALTWTSEKFRILTFAYFGWDQAELIEWWRTAAGPI